MDAVKGFVAVASGNSISLKWEAVEGAESYEIYRATDKNETYNQIGTTEKCNFNDQLEESGTYYYKVRGIKGSEEMCIRDRGNVADKSGNYGIWRIFRM